MPSVGFEPTVSAGERPKPYSLDRAATVTGLILVMHNENPKLELVLDGTSVVYSYVQLVNK